MRKSIVLALLLGLAWTCPAFDAHAQDTAAAIAFFDRAQAAFNRGDLAAACRDFAESQRLVPRLGTLFWLAHCEDTAGKIASADAHYHQFSIEVRALPRDKQEKYQERVEKAEAARAKFVGEIPTLTLELPANAPANVNVVRDGLELTHATLGVPIPTDPGEHVVTTQVPGGPLHQQRFVLARKETKQVVLEIELPPAVPVVASSEPLVDAGRQGRSMPEGQGSSGLRTGGFVLLGVGLAGLVAAGVMGSMSMSKKSSVDQNCPNKRCTNPDDIAMWNDGRTLANATSAGLGVGLVVVATAVTMLVVDASRMNKGKAAASASVVFVAMDRTGAAVGVRGRFE